MNHPINVSLLVSEVEREKIFAALLEFWHFPQWIHGLRWVRLLEGAELVQPGTKFSFGLSAAGLRHEVVSTMTEVDAPRSIQWRYISGAVGSGGWTLEDAGVKTVRLTFSTDYEVRPLWLDRLANRPFFRRVVEDLVRRSMRSLVENLKAA